MDRTRAGDLAVRTRLVSGRLACDRRRPPVADIHEPFFGEHQEREPASSRFQALKLGEVGHRRQRVARGQLPGADRCPHAIRGLLPFDPGVGPLGLACLAEPDLPAGEGSVPA